MSSGKNPLMLMMALSMPGAAHALGLGDIHVDSGLNERLAAEIDIVGATALDLTDLRAAVANRETFLRYGADRPAFLSSATFKVTQDSHGQPVLAVRSTESFTEPLVNLLVDLRWRNGALVRQYTLLLDPPGFAAVNRPPEANPVAASAVAKPIVETKTQTLAHRIDTPSERPSPKSAEHAARKTTHIKVGAKATLRGIAWRVGERSKSDLQRMMIAIFRANPNAFDGNINRLHRGAVLTIPSGTEVAAISKAEAKREVHAQMTAWRSAEPGARALDAMPATPVAGTVSKASATPAGEALDRRIQVLEQELSEMKGQLESERSQLLDLQQKAVRAEMPAPSVEPASTTKAVVAVRSPAAMNVSPAVEAPRATKAPQAQPKPQYAALIPIAAGLGILTATLAGLFYAIRRRVPTSKDSDSGGALGTNAVTADHSGDSRFAGAECPGERLAQATQERVCDNVETDASDNTRAADSTDTNVDADANTHAIAKTNAEADSPTDAQAIAAADMEATHLLPPVVPAVTLAGRSEIAAGAFADSAAHDPTVNLHVDTAKLRADPTRLDYNLLDLDLTAQHVQMPSVLNEHAVVKERRTNLADVLKLAIEREPDRHDLRMKLLELYYSAAATNRKAFLEAAQKFARDRDYQQTEQWDKIARMGRQIAPESPLFIEESAADDDLADCA